MFFLNLVFRNVFRAKLRTTLTIVGLVIATLAFGLLQTVVRAWYAGSEAASATRLSAQRDFAAFRAHLYPKKSAQYLVSPRSRFSTVLAARQSRKISLAVRGRIADLLLYVSEVVFRPD